METLYRKYRPLDFSTVVGQDHIVTTLKNQIAKGSIAHAYLFFGTKGTGKTTVAKIFARAINCPNEKNGNPCNECPACRSAIDGANLNIQELDAASNRGVEHIRKISDAIAYPPMNGEKYKVFIIDEAHALTDIAAQAFLKILEEPPEYVVYILATTEPNKLPDTILSRCQKYGFRRISLETTIDYLKKICDEEKIDVETSALEFIAEKSDGSMRESISKLDRCRASVINEKLIKEKVVDILGVVDDDDFCKLAKAVNTGDVRSAVKIVAESLEKGKDLIQLTNDFIWYLRNLLIVKNLDSLVDELNITKNSFDKLKKESESFDKSVLVYFIDELSKTSALMKHDENRRVMLETSLIRLANPSMNFLESSVMARVSSLEEKVKSGSFVKIDTENKTEIKNELKQEKKEEKREMKLNPATYEEINQVIENWKTIASHFDSLVKTVLFKASPLPGSDKEPGFIEVRIDDKFDFELLKDVKKIEEELSVLAKKNIKKDIVFKIVAKEDSRLGDKVTWSLDDAFKKINDNK